MLFAIPKAVFGLVLLLSSLFITTNAHPVHHTYRHGHVSVHPHPHRLGNPLHHDHRHHLGLPHKMEDKDSRGDRHVPGELLNEHLPHLIIKIPEHRNHTGHAHTRVGKPIRPKGWGWLGLHRGAKPDADEKHSHGQWRHGQGHHGHWRHGLHDHEVPAPKPGQSHADEEVRFGESRHRNGAVRVPQPAVSGALGKFGGNETVPTGVDKMTPPRPRLTPLSTPTPASAE
ncbi:hypothetical protein HDK77DRAFT_428563 [Phyllosticta capitalensis]